MHSTAAGHDIPTSTPATGTQCSVASAPSGHLTSARANTPYAPGITAPQRKKPQPVVKNQLGKQLSKSLSTPQLRGPIMSDSEDKKRNKLGYQRISIACAHCRRRKIRCLLAEDDNEQRCQNCIRLKKECVFYPVDQQAAMDARSEASNKTGGPSASSTVPSSPSQMGARPLEQPGHHYGASLQDMPSDGSRGFQGIPIVPSLAIPPQGNFAQPGPSFQPRGGETAVWSPQEFGTQSPAVSLGDPGHMPQHFARYGHTNMPVDTAPYPGSIEQGQQHLERFGYAPGQLLQQHWQPHNQNQHPQQQQPHHPVRSMSFPNNYADQMYSPSIHQSQPTSPYVQGPPFQQHQTDPHFAMAQGQSPFIGTPNPYMMGPDQRSSSIPNPSPFHPPHQMQAWYSDSSPYASVVQETHTLPSHNDDGGYPPRPG